MFSNVLVIMLAYLLRKEGWDYDRKCSNYEQDSESIAERVIIYSIPKQSKNKSSPADFENMT